MREYQLFPSPSPPDYVGSDEYNIVSRIAYTKKVYAALNKAAAWSADSAGVFNDLLLESATDAILTEASDRIYLEDSSSVITSLIYLFRNSTPVTLGGVSTDKQSGVDLADMSIVFPPNFFDAGNIMVFQADGTITVNATNNSLAFTITFPHGGSSATIAMPTTVTQDTLSDWTLTITSRLGFNSSNQGIVTHSGLLVVKNSTPASGESATVMTIVENTFNYQDTLYYKPQVAWATTAAGSTVTFYSATLTVV